MDFAAVLANQFVQFLLVFARVTGALTTAPVFGSKVIPVYVRVGLAILLSLMLIPFSSWTPERQPASLLMLGWWVLVELTYGLAAGYVAALFFQAVQMAGQLIDMQVGFGMINVFDPQYGQQVPLVGNFKFLMALVVFLALQGHHVIITGLADNFRTVPLGVQLHLDNAAAMMVDAVANMFVLSLRIALPVMGTVLMTDVALGILARIMPQMNVFVVGITGKLVVGMFMIYLILPFYVTFLEVGFEGIFRFDLQRFDSSEKTEEPTQRKQEESRKKGQVAKSAELSSVFVILAAFLALKTAGPHLYETLIGYMRHIFNGLSVRGDFTIQSVQLMITEAGMNFFEAVLPLMISVLLVAVSVSILQVGFSFNPDTIMPQFSRINPISGFGRIFSKRSLVELIKSLLKITVVGYFIFRFIQKETLRIPSLMMAEIPDSFALLAGIIYDLAFQIAMVILVLAILDYGYQWWEHMQNLKMSKQEVKEEMKQTEGNPQIKSKIREKQRAIATRRMMAEVPKADVVVTNPTHFAVALKYESGMEAPTVVAKGADFIAQRIREIAKENDVVIVENKPLAQALFKNAEVGDPIPPDLYKAVAEVLAYVYRLKRKYS